MDERTTTQTGPSNAFSAFRASEALGAILGMHFTRPKWLNPKTWPSLWGIKAVAMALIHYAGMSSAGVFFGSLAELVEKIGYNRRSVQRALRLLERLDVIKRFPGGAQGRAQARAFVEDVLGVDFPPDFSWRRTATYVLMIGRNKVRATRERKARAPRQQVRGGQSPVPAGVVLTGHVETLHQVYCAERKTRYGLTAVLSPPDVRKLSLYVDYIEKLAVDADKPFNVTCLDVVTEYLKEVGYDGKLGELGHPIGWMDKYIEQITLRLRNRYALRRQRVLERELEERSTGKRILPAQVSGAAQDVLAAIQGRNKVSEGTTTPRRARFRSASAPSMLAHLSQPLPPEDESPLPGGEQAPACSPFGDRGPP